MVEIDHTVVTNVAVGDSRGPEDHTGLTELHTVELRGGRVRRDVRYLQEVDPL
jgi:hypothetical protein